MSLFNNPVFNSVLTGLIVYGTSILTNSGFPLLGAILTTFPIGIMALLSVKSPSLLDKFLTNILTGNIIIVMTWLTMYFYSKNADADKLAIIGLAAWGTLSLIYFLYLHFKSN